jgi:hypothetical protein
MKFACASRMRAACASITAELKAKLIVSGTSRLNR